MKWRYFLLLVIFTFLLLPKNTFALSSYNLIPAKMRHYTADGNSSSQLSMQTMSYLNTPLYGYNFTVAGNRQALAYYFNQNSNITNKMYDVNFVYFSAIESDKFNPIRIYIRDEQSHIFTCDVRQSKAENYSGTQTLQTSTVNTATCNNVMVTSGFDLIFADNFATVGTFAVSSLTFTESSSSELKSSIDKSTQQQKETTESMKEQTDTIKNSDTTEANDSASGFFNDFTTDDYGLSDIVTIPLSTINTITSKTCSSLVLPLPFIDSNLTLPCIRTIFEEHFNPLLLIYQTVTFAFIAYYVIVRIFNLVKDFKNPEHDEIEVMEL